MSEPTGAPGPGRSGRHDPRRRIFDRDEWARLRASTPLPLDAAELDELRGINEHLSVDEVQDVYLPLSRLLNLRVGATSVLRNVTDVFLGVIRTRPPFVIGLAGSVAVGKSTTARVLRELLARWPDHPRVELVTTDGFLHPNAELAAAGIMHRKGFPESYDTGRLVRFLDEVKGGAEEVEVPVYDHAVYDVVPDRVQRLRRPDVVIVEGLNVLQVSGGADGPRVSDYFDWAIYVDADPGDIEQWYIDRFHTLRRAAAADPDAWFHRFATLGTDEATDLARQVWRTVNLPNLHENIEPTRRRADLVLEKGPDHRVRRVELRLF